MQFNKKTGNATMIMQMVRISTLFVLFTILAEPILAGSQTFSRPQAQSDVERVARLLEEYAGAIRSGQISNVLACWSRWSSQEDVASRYGRLLEEFQVEVTFPDHPIRVFDDRSVVGPVSQLLSRPGRDSQQTQQEFLFLIRGDAGHWKILRTLSAEVWLSEEPPPNYGRL